MKPNACKYLHDILEMAVLIETAVSGKSYDEYAAELANQRATMYFGLREAQCDDDTE